MTWTSRLWRRRAAEDACPYLATGEALDPGPFARELALRLGAGRIVTACACPRPHPGSSRGVIRMVDESGLTLLAVEAARPAADPASPDPGDLLLVQGLELAPEPARVAGSLRELCQTAVGVLVRTPDRLRLPAEGGVERPRRAARSAAGLSPQELSVLLASAGLEVMLHGYIGPGEGPARTVQAAFIPGTRSGLALGAAPPSAVAFVPCFNEVDIVCVTVDRLLGQGIDVHLIDNWSTDGSWELLIARYGRNRRVRLERFPGAPTAQFEWAAILERMDDLAASSPHEWVLHVDADEQFDSCSSSLSLLDHLALAEAAGCDVVDSTLVDFRPVALEEDEGSLPTHWHFASRPGARSLERAWRNRRQRVGLAETGGHALAVPKRAFPVNLVLRHYPLRTPAQARAKLFRDRMPRFEQERASRGWHVHYDGFTPDASFLWDASTLNEWSQDSLRDWMPEFSTRTGLVFDAEPGPGARPDHG